jgi:signal transduction histidine kinase
VPLELGQAGAVTPGTFGGFVILCAFLCMAGGLRLSRRATRVGIALALAVFLLGAVQADIGAGATVGIMVALVGVGLLSASEAGLVRRLVTDEVAKTVLTESFRDARGEVQARDQILKIVTHDLRNPLNTIRMGSDLLLTSAVPDDRRMEVMQRIRRAETGMERLVRDLMDVAKLESGRLAMSFVSVAPATLLREIHDDLAPAVREKGLACELDVPDELPQIQADAWRLQQVISNLVGNAVKFTPTGGRITIAARPAPAGVRFTVQDSGQGIPPEQIDRLFQRFWQADTTDRRGLGLGLAIAKMIVEAHAGRIWCESTVGEGTSMHFVIGVRLPAESPDRRVSRMQGAVAGE